MEKLPTIGPKTAQRLAFYLLKRPVFEIEKLANAMLSARKNLKTCPVCFNLTDRNICRICSDPKREKHTLCVVCNVQELSAIEKTGKFNGKYHVLGGALSPLEGIGPDKLKIDELLARIRRERIQETILATSLTIQGEATSLYLAKLLENHPLKVTRIAVGLPVGADLEYADELTLAKALEGRKTVGQVK